MEVPAAPARFTEPPPPDRLALDRSSFDGSVGLSVEIAHDMRSPLTAILFLLDVIRSGRTGPVTPAQARQLGIAYGAALGLSQMATNLIDHARGNARIIEAEPVPFSVNELLYAVRDILGPVSEERGLVMHVETLHDHARTGFPMALHRILLNLATNAVKYTRQGTVTLTARPLANQHVEFAVADTGPGMPDYVQAQLFQPFRLTPTSARPTFSSSGLGLSICHDLATALGSTLSVSTSRGDTGPGGGGGGGTRFWFEVELPIAPGG